MAALLAGGIAGGIVTAFQAARLTPLIAIAERYEAAGAADHSHEGHSHAGPDAMAWQPTDGTERLVFTLLFNLLAGVGFALILNAGLALRGVAGDPPDIASGTAWGIAGFASFALAPALGLPPELPGMQAADLLDRQVWWGATAFATAGGLGLLAYAITQKAVRRGGAVALGIALIGIILIVGPHIVGAPHPDGAAEPSPVPADLAVQFAIGSLAAAAVFWVVLGSVSGWLQRRLG